MKLYSLGDNTMKLADKLKKKTDNIDTKLDKKDAVLLSDDELSKLSGGDDAPVLDVMKPGDVITHTCGTPAEFLREQGMLDIFWCSKCQCEFAILGHPHMK